MIDYALIRQILERLYAVYPATEEGIWKIDPNENKCVQHLSYLAEHGMISVPISRDKKGNYSIGRAKITSRGIDFLQPDGGLSALAAPIIRISPDSITALIDAALITRNVPADQRSVIQKALGVAGPEGVKVVVQRLIDAGLAHSPDIFRLFTLP